MQSATNTGTPGAKDTKSGSSKCMLRSKDGVKVRPNPASTLYTITNCVDNKSLSALSKVGESCSRMGTCGVGSGDAIECCEKTSKTCMLQSLNGKKTTIGRTEIEAAACMTVKDGAAPLV